MKNIRATLATWLALGWVGSAVAVPTVWVSDNGGGLFSSAITSPLGLINYASRDPFWAWVTVTAVAAPPGPLAGSTLSQPVLVLSVQAMSLGNDSANLHPLTVTLGDDGLGPTSASFRAALAGHYGTGSGESFALNTYYDTGNHITPPAQNPSATPLTASGSLAGQVCDAPETNGPVCLSSPYSLFAVITISNGPVSGTYSLDATLSTQPPQDVTLQMRCPPGATVPCGSDTNPATTSSAVAFGCGCPTISHSDRVAPGNCPGNYIIYRTWTATDACTNTTNCVQTIQVVDPPPTITCSSNKTVECGSSWIFDLPSAFGSCCTNVTISELGTVTNYNGHCGNTFDATRTWQAVDCCGNSNFCSQTVSVVCPSIPCLAVTKTASSGGCGQPIFFSGTVSNCGNTSLTNISVTDSAAGSVAFIPFAAPGASVAYSGSHPGGPGTNTDTVCASGTDLCTGTNVSACATAVAVVTCPVPQIICPPNITVTSTGQCQGVTVSVAIPAVTNTCPGVTPVCTRSDGKALTDPYPVGVTSITCTVTGPCGQTAQCSFTVTVTSPVSIASNFNGTPIPGGSTVWFSSIVNVSRHNICPETITFLHQTITSAAFTLAIPDGEIHFVAGGCPATTSFVGGKWVTTVGCEYTGRVFISGFAYQVPASGLPGGINPVTWSGTFLSSTPGVTLQWLWAAAAYSSFASDNNSIGVKPVDGSSCTTYANSDHAGTPENWKSKVIGGARGGGGSNWTGSLSGTLGLTPCVVPVAPTDVRLTIQTLDGQIQLSWPMGTLQEADTAAGPYSDVTGATSPYIVSPTAPHKVYRVRVQ